MKWNVVTSKGSFEVEAERHADAEKIAWRKMEKGEELLYIVRAEAWLP